MSEHNLHPSVQKFKKFVNEHPDVKSQLRENHKLIQSYYEKWMILGEDDPFWTDLPQEEEENGLRLTKKEWMKQFSNLLQEINWEDVSKHIEDLNGAIDQIQEIISKVQHENRDSAKRRPMEYPYY
ncbi:spore coat protein YlbD [Halobacillus seohaensis]|uniref:Spore coat protein YlbD n=1 Tax=Halobacillus seohaensis TaxID=447421 RepID=A0ABW2EG77_9BACI